GSSRKSVRTRTVFCQDSETRFPESESCAKRCEIPPQTHRLELAATTEQQGVPAAANLRPECQAQNRVTGLFTCSVEGGVFGYRYLGDSNCRPHTTFCNRLLCKEDIRRQNDSRLRHRQQDPAHTAIALATTSSPPAENHH